MVKDNKKINEKDLDAVVGGDFGKRASSSKENMMQIINAENDAIGLTLGDEKNGNASSSSNIGVNKETDLA